MSSDRPQSSSKRLNWMAPWYKDKPAAETLPSVSDNSSAPINNSRPALGGALPLARSSSSSAVSASPYPSAYGTDTPSAFITRRFSSSSLMSKDQLDQEASKIILTALERTTSQSSQDTAVPSRTSGPFSRKSLSSMMGGLSGGLSALSLTRSGPSDDKDRGRSRTKEDSKPRSASAVSDKSVDECDQAVASRARSTSPFRRRKLLLRDPSPSVEALKLSQADVESENEVTSSRKSIRPRNAFSQSSVASDSEDADDIDDDSESEESWSEDGALDSITVQNTEQNSLVPEPQEIDVFDAPDPLGEGVNVVIPPEPYFPSTLNSTGNRNPRRRRSTKHVSLSLTTSRPEFKRDRCTITLTQGDPEQALQLNGRRPRRYVVASDLSEESHYAIEWGVGTVLRDGDEMFLVSVVENEAKVDPPHPNPADRVSKLRNQQERQTLAYILVRQVIGLLQRTKLHVRVICQAWHAKNSRYMLLDIVDYIEPVMLIVGSRGLGQLKGILLGSTSHYLVQKCSVPVMVARRRLRRPARRSAHLSSHRARVSLAEAAGVERITPKVDHEVADMRNQLENEDERRHGIAGVDDDEDTEHEADATPIGEKVAGD